MGFYTRKSKSVCIEQWSFKIECQGERGRFTWIQKDILGVGKEKEARNLPQKSETDGQALI